MTGVAFSTHYYAIFLAIPLAWSVARAARDRCRRGQADRRSPAAVSAAVFFVLSPFILLEPATALRDIRANQQIVVDRAVGHTGLCRRPPLRYGVLLLARHGDLAGDRCSRPPGSSSWDAARPA